MAPTSTRIDIRSLRRTAISLAHISIDEAVDAYLQGNNQGIRIHRNGFNYDNLDTTLGRTVRAAIKEIEDEEHLQKIIDGNVELSDLVSQEYIDMAIDEAYSDEHAVLSIGEWTDYHMDGMTVTRWFIQYLDDVACASDGDYPYEEVEKWDTAAAGKELEAFLETKTLTPDTELSMIDDGTLKTLVNRHYRK